MFYVNISQEVFQRYEPQLHAPLRLITSERNHDLTIPLLLCSDNCFFLFSQGTAVAN